MNLAHNSYTLPFDHIPTAARQTRLGRQKARLVRVLAREKPRSSPLFA